MRTFKAGAAYFALVFSVGFVLGAIRTFWVVPRTGVRNAELLESPLMLLVIFLAARRMVRRGSRNLLGAGLMALALLLAAEIAVAIGLRHERLSEYISSRDPVSGTVYLILLLAFAAMPLMASFFGAARDSSRNSELLDPFIPNPDVRERHEIIIDAPAGVVFEVARNLDIQSIAIVRIVFWLRARILRAKPISRPRKPFLADMLLLGWRVLAEDPGKYLVAGAACQPWKSDVTFIPIEAADFASFRDPGLVKIAWTLEAEAEGPARTRFATETRAAATDAGGRVDFQRYWRKFRPGIVMIRRILLSAIRREAESVGTRQLSK